MRMTFPHTIIHLAWIPAILFVMLSCTFETEIEQPVSPVAGGMTEIPFMARIPAVTVVETRGIAPENKIDDIHVLVFETTGELVYKGKGKSMVVSGVNNNTVAFKATLPVGKTYDFMVLANAESILSEISAGAEQGKTKTDVEALVLQTTDGNSENGKWKPSVSIPMWDEQRMELTASSSPVFYLTRMLARINVEYKPAAGADDVFRLTDIHYYNYNTSGKVVPNAVSNMAGTEGARYAIRPTLPDNPGTRSGESLTYTAITDHKTCKNQIYVFEAANQGTYTGGDDTWIDNPCIVAGGKYDSDKDGNFDEEPVTYYRIDFIGKTVSGETTADRWLSLLRNFSYNVVISSVNGEGYGDPEVALRSLPLNITAGVIDWNDGRMDEVIFDGTAYLSVDKHELLLPRNGVDTELADGSNILRIKTDYTVNGYPANSGWKAEYYTDPEGKIPMESPWLKLVNGVRINAGAPTGTPDDPAAEAHFTFGENIGINDRDAWVYITAGRLRYRVHVVQKLLSIDLFEVVNGIETPVDTMRFMIPYTGYNTYQEQRTFRVRWKPVSQNIRVTNDAPVSWNPFNPAWVRDVTTNGFPLPVPGGEWLFANMDESGMREFVVTAPPMLDADEDPFCEKTSTYRFEVGNGQDVERKGITLHYVYYNLLVGTYVYRLDGKTYSMSVRSNAEWKITKVEEWLYNQDPAIHPRPAPVMLDLKPFDNLKVETKGGPNVTGESVAFTVVDAEETAHERKWGTVWVTFESPDGKFPPQRIPLTFSPETRSVLSLGYTNDVRAFNVGKTSPYHKTSVFEMLSNISIFGESDKAIVKTPPLELFAYNCEGLSTIPNNSSDDEWHWRKGDLKKWINLHKPSFIVISYSMILNANESKLLVEYMRNNGAVIMYYGGNAALYDQTAPFFKELFGITRNMTYTHHQNDVSATSIPDLLDSYDNPTEGLVMKLAEDVDHPILNGPFGDVRGQKFGLHVRRHGIARSLVEDQVIPLCWSETNVRETSVDYGYTYMFVHKTLPLFWVGNDMGTATYYHANRVVYYDPVSIDNNGYPEVRHNFGPTLATSHSVYNSFVLANAVTWAISKSNYQHPANNYSDFAD